MFLILMNPKKLGGGFFSGHVGACSKGIGFCVYFSGKDMLLFLAVYRKFPYLKHCGDVCLACFHV